MDMFELLLAKKLAGSGGGEGIKVYRNTTEYWNAQTTTTSELNALYIYIDFDTDEHGLIPALKIGDGVKTVPALRFISAGSAAMITENEITKWNENVSVDSDELSEETLSLI